MRYLELLLILTRQSEISYAVKRLGMIMTSSIPSVKSAIAPSSFRLPSGNWRASFALHRVQSPTKVRHHSRRVVSKQGNSRLSLYLGQPNKTGFAKTADLSRDFKIALSESGRASRKKVLLQKATSFIGYLVNTPELMVAYFKHSAVQYTEI